MANEPLGEGRHLHVGALAGGHRPVPDLPGLLPALAPDRHRGLVEAHHIRGRLDAKNAGYSALFSSVRVSCF